MKRYKRPTALSDPYFDFTEEELKAILAKSDEELGQYEYMCIFGEFLPAGTYEECAYFIRPLLNEHGSPLLDELVRQPIVKSRSGRIVDDHVLKSDDRNLWAFWAKYGKD